MKILKKQTIIFVISILFILSQCNSVFADSDKLIIKLELENNIMNVDGNSIKVEKPFLSDNNIFVPFRAIFEAFGAEINWKGSGKINLIYRDIFIDMIIGEKKYTVNQVEKYFPAVPVSVNKSTMVPLKFIEDNFEVVTNYNKSTKTIFIIMEDDGSLTDFSFLTDSISKPKVGDSYFEWSINVPNGSRLKSSSFNSKYVCIENEHRGITLEISVEPDKGKSLKQYFDEINKNPEEFFGKDTIDSSLATNARTIYAEFLYYNSSDESVLYRVFAGAGNFYNVTLTSFDEIDPKKLKSSVYYKGIMDSFEFGYKGNSNVVQDLSMIKYGFAKYENYVLFDSGNRHLTWELNVIPEWNILKRNDNEPLNTKIGLNSGEYINIKIGMVDEDKNDLEKYGDKNLKLYNLNFNTKYYEFIEKKIMDLAGYKTYKVIFSMEKGGIKYIIDENFIISGDMVYDIVLKAPADKYKTRKETYYKILESFKISSFNNSTLQKDIENYNIKYSSVRVAKDDSLTDFQNKSFKWGFKIPGYWIKENYSDGSSNIFLHPDSDLAIAVEAIENSPQNKDISDDVRFKFIKTLVQKYNMKLLKQETINDKGTNVRVYVYRLESEENETFADVKCYIINKEKYSYCFATVIPDLYSSEKNLEEIQEIWASFNTEN